MSPTSRTSTVSTPPPPPSPASSLRTAAREWAKSQDFLAESLRDQAVAPREAGKLPTSVRRALDLYSTWAQNDLGSVRLFKLTLEGKRVWALHTSTDGDDGFLELFDGRGDVLATGLTGFTPRTDGTFATKVTWDSKPFTVRDQVTLWGDLPSVQAFQGDLAQARTAGSEVGTKVGAGELRQASGHLVGDEPGVRAVDGFEGAFLQHALANPAIELTRTARAYGEQLGGLYGAPEVSSRLVSVKERAAATPLGGAGSWSKALRFASGEDRAGDGTPRIGTLAQLAQRAWKVEPGQVAPVTTAEAQALLRDAGASAAEARQAVAAFAQGGSVLFAGRLFGRGEDWLPRPAGQVLYAVSKDAKSLRALRWGQVEGPATSSAAAQLARDTVKALTGVDREVEVLSDTTAQGTGTRTLELLYRPAMTGGSFRALLELPPGGEPSVSLQELRPVLEAALKDDLTQQVSSARGQPVEVVGWVGQDDAQGPAFIVAHRAPDAAWPVRLSTVRPSPDGSQVTERKLSVEDHPLASDLAVNLARHHAEQWVADPSLSDAARLEVALRTRWVGAESLESGVHPDEGSPVGFDPAQEHFQFMLPRVWGGAAVFVTFAKDGTVRLDHMD